MGGVTLHRNSTVDVSFFFFDSVVDVSYLMEIERRQFNMSDLICFKSLSLFLFFVCLMNG